MNVNEVKKRLAIRSRSVAARIKVLIDMSLISVHSKWGRETIEMHDLLEEMGRTIVLGQGIEDPGKRSRLFNDEDVCHVLKSNTETPNVRAIKFNWSRCTEQPFECADFKVMSNLKLLIVDYYPGHPRKITTSLNLPNSLRYLYWWGYLLESLPSIFSPENLVELHMPYSQVKKLWKKDQRLMNLEVIDLHDCIYLMEVPNLFGSPKIRHINLSNCRSLVEIPLYFQHLDKLTHLDVGLCTSLKYLPEMPKNIEFLFLPESGIKELPESVWSHENISQLRIWHCKDLEKLPSNKCKLKVSGCFNLDGCTSLGEFSELPRDISKLSLVDCKRLVSLPTNICKLKYLEELNLSGCSELENFPEILEPMEHLVSLSLQGTAVERLPLSIGNLIRLQTLYLSGCKHLKDVLTSLDLYACPEFKKLPSSSLGSFSLKGFVGIESCIEQIESLLYIHSQDTCLSVGIWGMGRIGKTTLAEAVFHRLSSKFEACCFLKNVRENSEQAGGLDHLEKTLFKEILKEEVFLPVGSTFQERLSRTKVLIVLDDVGDSWQMERLVGDHLRYGSGSRIIITSRDRGTLGKIVDEAKIYYVEGLKSDDALQLFYLRAFKDNSTRRTDYKDLAEKAVAYAKGIPLALTVLGSLFFNCKSKEEWEDEFNKLKRYPSEDIQKVLRISFDRLRENEKEIFLDIACFHKGKSLVEVKRMLVVRGLFATSGIRILIEMSLISIDSKGGRETIEMHDLLQEMGRKIVQKQGMKDPGKRSRLFNDEDVCRVLRSNTETPNVEAIRVYWPYIEEQALKHADFKKMSNLIMLIVDGGYKFNASLDLPDSLRYLDWFQYPLESLPSNFSPDNLVELHMPGSQVKKLWKEEQRLVNLQVIDMHDSRYLTEVPNLSGSLKIVNINLRGCVSLVEIPGYFQHLDKLTLLDLGGCTSLKYLPEMARNIKYLNLQYSGLHV